MDFCRQLHADSVHFWYAGGASRMRGEEFHNDHEIMYLFCAEGSFLSEGKSIPLHPDMLILIPKERFHNFALIREEQYLRCRLWFPDVPEWDCLMRQCMDQIRILHAPTPEMTSLFQRLCNMLSDPCSEEEKKLFLRTAAVQLLFMMKNSLNRFSISESRDQNSLIARVLAYVNSCYQSPVSLTQTASALYVSTSQLSHCFSRELGISFYQYVLQKRLICAKRLLQSGESAAQAAIQSGFSDYSAFYRAYKKYYGQAPTHPEI